MNQVFSPHIPHPPKHSFIFNLLVLSLKVCCGTALSLMLSCSVMSSSLRPPELSPTRLLGPGDFPGKNTEVICHFLPQGIFTIQRSNLHLLWLLHCGWILYHRAIEEALSGSNLKKDKTTYTEMPSVVLAIPLQYVIMTHPRFTLIDLI